MSQKEPRTGKLWHMLTGGIAGGVSRTLTNPLERLKILRQCGTPEYANMSTWQAMLKFGKSEGLKGFFKGNGSNVIKIVPFSAIEFWTYEQCKEQFGHSQKSTIFELLVSGSVAGIHATVWTYPLDLVRTYLAINLDHQNEGIVGELGKIYRSQGLKGLFRGMGMSIYGIAPFIGLKMTSFELMKRRYLPSRDHPHFISVNLALGGASAVFATTLTYPSDVLRRKLQVLAFTEDLPYDNLTSCIKHIYKTEGYAGFFRGLVPCYLKVVPSIAILFACNEELKKLLNIV